MLNLKEQSKLYKAMAINMVTVIALGVSAYFMPFFWIRTVLIGACIILGFINSGYMLQIRENGIDQLGELLNKKNKDESL